ncbi:MAG: type II secretion system major pseudopilin GspG [Candidatus Sumerlaeota bacterium]|nr:type II secretion system major pseudopilin GspG [Candidatus Sumerlaeota bacterium]
MSRIKHATLKGKSAQTQKRRFSKTEIMLVVLILGVLMFVVAPNIPSFNNAKRQLETTRQQMENIEMALRLYYARLGQYPSDAQGLRALKTCPLEIDPGKWGRRPYLESIPKDAWGHDFVYHSPGKDSHEYDLISPGKDGQEGTADDIAYSQTDDKSRDA